MFLGRGIPINGRDLIGTAHSTSKISNFEDIYSTHNYYGFRGEALHMIVEAANDVTIVTKTAEEGVGCEIRFRHGQRSTRAMPCETGNNLMFWISVLCCILIKVLNR